MVFFVIGYIFVLGCKTYTFACHEVLFTKEVG
jgi:hypothetical protein